MENSPKLSQITETLSHTAASLHWQKIGVRHHHGICLPLFSLRSQNSYGIGEYLDLIPLFPWLKKCGFNILQLLPLNEIGPTHASPYSALSAFALHPLFLSLAKLPYLKETPPVPAFNALPQIDYKQVRAHKEAFLKDYCHRYQETFGKEEAFHTFVHNNAWLKDYASFKKQSFQEAALIQYLCFCQLKAVKKAAEKEGILLKGDIPILIHKKSVDVQKYPHLFLTQFNAGAPPDAFNPKGQNWKFPLYNWEAMEKENYHWWQQRLDNNSQFFDLYRLDHIVGFYRIYEVKGHYYPKNEKEWIPQGDKILKMLLKHSTMLPIGEDLGQVPENIKQHLTSLGICGTKVIRWERDYHTKPFPYIPYACYPPLSMTTVSTHDTPPLPEWWETQSDEKAQFALFKGWKIEKKLSSDHLLEMLKDSHHTPSLFHINLFQEYLALIPGMTWGEDRINRPGIRSRANWAYRFKPSIDEIISHSELEQALKACVS